MSKILIVYGSTYGQTERVARRITAILKNEGHIVDMYKGTRFPSLSLRMTTTVFSSPPPF